MTDDTKLVVLKQDLQLLTPAHDEYLKTLLSLAKSAIEREGIILESNIECDMAVVYYAAYLFRKRASNETAMPRFLRYQLNNILLSQKGRVAK
jgi:hypothetical protein